MTQFSLVSFSLDIMGFVLLLILFSACLGDRTKNEVRSITFLWLLGTLMLALVADAGAWACELDASLSLLATVLHVASEVLCILVLMLLGRYLRQALFYRNRAVYAVTLILDVLGGASILCSIANAYHGFAWAIIDGHFILMSRVWLTHTFPVASLFAIFLIILLGHGVPRKRRLFYLSLPLFPLAGAIQDCFLPFSVTLIGLVICALLVYTGVYLQRRRLVMDQRNALMLSQINPHFMYNTLTTVAALCDTAPADAKALIIDFSSYLRRNLSAMTEVSLIPFEDELRHVGCYLKIEKARFGDRLRVVYDIRAKSFECPVLSIQPLVENAVKHGITKKREGGTIRIRAFDTDRYHVVEILDDGVGFDTTNPQNEMHVGIENVRSRLSTMCNGTLEVRSTEGVGTRITVCIPRGKEKKQ